VEKLIDIANGNAEIEKPKTKKAIKVDKMPAPNGKRKTEPAMAE